MIRNNKELVCVLPTNGGKHSAMWVASYDVVNDWLSGGWRRGVHRLFELGTVRFVVAVSPDGRQSTLQPPITELPTEVDGACSPLPPNECFRVITLLLTDLHEAYRAHESLSLAIQRVVRPTCPPAA